MSWPHSKTAQCVVPRNSLVGFHHSCILYGFTNLRGLVISEHLVVVCFSQFGFKCVVGEEKPPPLVDVDSVQTVFVFQPWTAVRYQGFMQK